jgi:hypothetical protein
MSSESNTFPIFFKLQEQRGEKTERLMDEIKSLALRFNISEDIKFIRILPSNSSANENILIYALNATPNNTPKSVSVINFLEYLFQKLFDKYPAFTEPDTELM